MFYRVFFPLEIKFVSQKLVWSCTFLMLCSCIPFLWFLTSKIIYTFFLWSPYVEVCVLQDQKALLNFFVFYFASSKWERAHLKVVPQAILILLCFLLNESQIGINIYFRLNNKKTLSTFQSQYDVKTLELTVDYV